MREIKISEIISLLDKGYTRDMVKKHYSLTPKELKNVVNDLKQVRDYLPRATFQPNIKVLQNYLDTTQI